MLDAKTARRPLNPYARERRRRPEVFETMAEAVADERVEIAERVREMGPSRLREFYLRLVGMEPDALAHTLTPDEFAFIADLAAHTLDEVRLDLAEED